MDVLFYLFGLTQHYLKVTFINTDGTENMHPSPPFRIKLSKKMREISHALPGNVNASDTASKNNMVDDEGSQKEKLRVETYIPADPVPYPQDKPNQNSVRFTPTQVLFRSSTKTFLSEYCRIG